MVINLEEGAASVGRLAVSHNIGLVTRLGLELSIWFSRESFGKTLIPGVLRAIDINQLLNRDIRAS